MSASMEVKSPSRSEEENFMISEIQSNMPKDMMNNNPLEEDLRSKELAQILRQMISKSVQEFRATCRAQMAEEVTVSPITVPQKKGKQLKNRVVGEQFVSFRLPENCNIASIKDIDKVQAKLGDWRIQSRQRDTKMRDTYYYHFSSQRTFRSITEVVNFILPENYPKEPNRKKKRKGQEVMASRKVMQKGSPEVDNQINEANKRILEEFLQECYQNLQKTDRKTNNEKEMQVNTTVTETVEVTITEAKGDSKLEKCLQEAGSLEVKGSNMPEESGTKDRKENLEFENISKDIMQSQLEVQTGSEHEYETLGEVTEKMKSIDVESIDIGKEEETHHYPELEDIPKDWEVHDNLISTYFDEQQ